MDGKIKQHVCLKFFVKLSKSATQTHEMICEAFGEHSLSWTTVFEWHSRFKTRQVSVEDDECSGRPSTSKTTEKVEKIRELVNKDHCRAIHELTDTIRISYGVCQEILTENLNVHLIAPSSRQCTRPHVPETTESVTDNNKVIVPRPPCSPDTSLHNFALFPKLKMKLKGRRFEILSDIQGGSNITGTDFFFKP
jgi:hypothetical protein